MSAAASPVGAPPSVPGRPEPTEGELSREVLGPGEDGGGPDLGDTGAPAGDPAVTDLDAPEPLDAAPSPAGDPSWHRVRVPPWVWTPWGLLAAVVAGVLLGGFLVGGVQERRAFEAGQGPALLATVTEPLSGGIVRDAGLRMRLLLLNTGSTAVTVTRARLAEGDTTLVLDHRARVEPGRPESVDVTVHLDCPGRASGGLLLTVQAPDGRTREVLADDLGRGVGILPGELSGFCGVQAEQPLPVWQTLVRQDGALSLHLRNGRDVPVELTLRSPLGTRAVSEPPMPLRLDPGQSTFILITVQVDRCTHAARRAQAGLELELLVDGRAGQASPDEAVLAGWFAQLMTRACDPAVAPTPSP